MGNGRKVWAEGERERLIALLQEGIPNGGIAREMGYASAGAVAGLVFRNDLAKYRVTRPPAHMIKTKTKPPVKLVRPIERKPDLPPTKPKSLLKILADLNSRECHWPVDYDKKVPGHHLFCGKRTKDGAVYCEGHREKATAIRKQTVTA